ncbi:MAG TPA: HEAT repeat domain-containing protein, partial [Polyangiaceae bacterium]
LFVGSLVLFISATSGNIGASPSDRGVNVPSATLPPATTGPRGIVAASASTRPTAALAHVPASGGQPELSVGFDSQGRMRAAVCSASSCNVEGGVSIAVPDSFGKRLSQTRFTIVPIGERRHALHVFIPSEPGEPSFEALIVARPGQPNMEILFQGLTGYTEGEAGLRRGPTLEISEPIDDAGTRRIVLGEQREELTLCGRPAILAPKMLTAKELAWKPAKVQRLSPEERERAQKLVAEPHAADEFVAGAGNTATVPAGPPSSTGPHTTANKASLLRPIGATSGVGWPAALTDGDVETTWAENRGGAGRGEFVAFRVPSDVPLQSVEFVVRPAKREIKNGVGPEKLWLVSDKLVYSINFPSDPWKAPGVTWKVALPSPLQTNCIAIVTESAYGERPDSEVTLAEINARSEFTLASIDNLVGALAGGGPRADAAGTVLASLGPEAFAAVAKAFAQLDEGGRRVALDVLDHAPCADASAVYVAALLSQFEAHRLHAVDRLHRCGAGAVEAIELALAQQPVSRLRPLIEMLAEVAPDRALRLLVPRMVGSAKTRRILREVVGKAARSPKAKEAVLELLGRTDLPRQASVDLLRALGRQITDYAEPAAASIQRLLVPEVDFTTKYLLLSPAHLVTDKSPALANTLSTLMRNDKSEFVRTEAVRSVVDLNRFASDLLRALDDSDVRVRQSAAQSLSAYKKHEAVLALGQRLRTDDWPIVRVAAAEALAAQSVDPEADKALLAALGDSSWLVKAAAAESVGTRKLTSAGEPLLDLFTDKKERFEVRIAAARAIGDICFDRALDQLTESVATLRHPAPDPQARAIASTALDAMAKLHPSDLASRLEPLLSGKDTPAGTRNAARAALATPPHCQVPPALTTASADGRY